MIHSLAHSQHVSAVFAFKIIGSRSLISEKDIGYPLNQDRQALHICSNALILVGLQYGFGGGLDSTRLTCVMDLSVVRTGGRSRGGLNEEMAVVWQDLILLMAAGYATVPNHTVRHAGGLCLLGHVTMAQRTYMIIGQAFSADSANPLHISFIGTRGRNTYGIAVNVAVSVVRTDQRESTVLGNGHSHTVAEPSLNGIALFARYGGGNNSGPIGQILLGQQSLSVGVIE